MTPFGGEQKVKFAGQTLLLEKPAASLGPRLRTSLGNFLAWCCPWTVTHYCSSMWVVMKLQHIVQGKSKDTSGP